MIETRLSRWVNASLAIPLKAKAEELNLQFSLEGVNREFTALFQNDSAILRITGPTPKFGSGITRYKFEAMVLVTHLVSNTANRYKVVNAASEIANELCGPIPVYQYPDSDTQAGCLDFDRDADEPLRIVNFGVIEKDIEVTQAAVIVQYEICLDS